MVIRSVELYLRHKHFFIFDYVYGIGMDLFEGNCTLLNVHKSKTYISLSVNDLKMGKF